MVDCVFRDVWSKVVVPHYVKLLGEEKGAADSSPTDEVQFLCAEGRPASVRHNSLTGSTNPSPTHRPRPTTGPANMRKESLVSQPSSAGAALTRHPTDDDTVLMKGKRKKKERKGVNPTETLVELEAKGETEAFLPARRGYRHNSDSHNTLNSGNTSVRHSTIMFAEDLEQSPPDAKNTKNNSNSASPASPFREKEATPIRTSSANNRSVLATNRAETAGQMAAVYGVKPKKKRKKVTSESGKNTLNRKSSKKGKPPVSPPEDGGVEMKPQSAAGARPPRSDGHSSPLQSGRRYKELVPMEVPPTKPGSGPDLEPTPPVGITPGSLLARRTVSGRTRRLEPLTKKAE
ncbi:hypothetical protein AGDE_13723 [Angomonas deanei]|nr:hypothetical protein AGDE_13723 [Angomonas deanei]|eukprot:EPY21889.1 hypothetical protein AGDE_13723 [Angomonas deanei]